MKSFIHNQKALTTKAAGLILALALMIAIPACVYGYYQGWFGPQAPSGSQPNDWWPSGTTAPTQPPSGGQYDAAALRGNVINGILGSGVTTSATTISVKAAVNGRVNFLDKASGYDTVTVAANPEETNTPFAQGTEVFVQVSCTGNPTNGLDYYDGLYHTVLNPGAPVYRVGEQNLVEYNNGGQYEYSFNSAGAEQTGTVAYTTVSTTPYWYLGNLAMMPRTAAAGANIKLVESGVTLASVTDGSTWIDTAAEITANATLTSHTSARLTITMTADNSNLGWGKSQPIVAATTGRINWYKPVIIMSTAMTGIGTAQLQAEGWESISASTLYAEKAFFKVVTSNDVRFSGIQWPTSGQLMDWSMSLPVNTEGATASTAYLFKFWVVDMCNTDNLRGNGGDTTTMPTAYGALSYGVGARIGNTAFTISSGAGATNQLEAYITTAS